MRSHRVLTRCWRCGREGQREREDTVSLDPSAPRSLQLVPSLSLTQRPSRVPQAPTRCRLATLRAVGTAVTTAHATTCCDQTPDWALSALGLWAEMAPSGSPGGQAARALFPSGSTAVKDVSLEGTSGTSRSRCKLSQNVLLPGMSSFSSFSCFLLHFLRKKTYNFCSFAILLL